MDTPVLLGYGAGSNGRPSKLQSRDAPCEVFAGKWPSLLLLSKKPSPNSITLADSCSAPDNCCTMSACERMPHEPVVVVAVPNAWGCPAIEQRKRWTWSVVGACRCSQRIRNISAYLALSRNSFLFVGLTHEPIFHLHLIVTFQNKPDGSDLKARKKNALRQAGNAGARGRAKEEVREATRGHRADHLTSSDAKKTVSFLFLIAFCYY